MTDTEARNRSLASDCACLRIAHLVNDLAQLEPLLVATGGNPKAIEIALGLVKHERRPLQHVIDDLYAARGELFDDLFVACLGATGRACTTSVDGNDILPD